MLTTPQLNYPFVTSNIEHKYNKNWFGFCECVKRDYGDEVIDVMKRYRKVNIILSKSYPKRHFLLKCRKFDIIPQSLINKRGYFNELKMLEHP